MLKSLGRWVCVYMRIHTHSLNLSSTHLWSRKTLLILFPTSRTDHRKMKAVTTCSNRSRNRAGRMRPPCHPLWFCRACVMSSELNAWSVQVAAGSSHEQWTLSSPARWGQESGQSPYFCLALEPGGEHCCCSSLPSLPLPGRDALTPPPLPLGSGGSAYPLGSRATWKQGLQPDPMLRAHVQYSHRGVWLCCHIFSGSTLYSMVHLLGLLWYPWAH